MSWNIAKARQWTGMLLLMLLLMVAAACSAGENTNSPDTDNSVAHGENETGDEQHNPAVDEKELEPVELVWYLRHAEPPNAESVIAKFNELVYDKIKATVRFEFINPGDYENKMQLVMTSGEKYDLAFTSSWANSYLNNVSRGAYLRIDELVEAYPEMKGIMRDEIWDAIRVGGNLYGVPNNQIMTTQSGLWFKKEVVDKYDLDIENMQSLQDLEDILQVVQENEPDLIPLRKGEPLLFRGPYQPSIETNRVDPETLKVINEDAFLLERFMIMRDWNQRGFFPSDVATMKNEEALLNEGRIFSRYSRAKPGNAAELEARYGYAFIDLAIGEPVISRSGPLTTITAVSATSEHPERAVMLLNLVNTDKEVFNTLVFGLEDQDFRVVSENRIEPIEGGYLLANWMVGNVFNSYVIPGQDDDVWEQTKLLNDTATVDPFIDFSFDRTKVENELARLSAVDAEFIPVLYNGLDDPEKTMQEYRSKQEASGRALVIEEIERQLAEHYTR